MIWLLVLSVSVFSSGVPVQAAQDETEKIFHAVEMKGVLCGYSETDLSTVVKDGKEMTLEKSRVFIMLSALGMNFNTEVKSTAYMDPLTGRFNDVKIDIEQGQVKLGIKVVVENNIAHYTPLMGGKPKDIKLTPEIILVIHNFSSNW